MDCVREYSRLCHAVTEGGLCKGVFLLYPSQDDLSELRKQNSQTIASLMNKLKVPWTLESSIFARRLKENADGGYFDTKDVQRKSFKSIWEIIQANVHAQV